jgi:hypothetical protein
VIFWDNNILQSVYWKEVFDELIQLSNVNVMKIDFNQGLDARLITDEVAEKLSRMKLMCVRIAYDNEAMKESVKNAIEKLSARGIRRRSMLVYLLYNFDDDPDCFLARMRDVLRWGGVVYPMRYEPLDALERWDYVSPKWDKRTIEIVEDFRRVYGYGGTFPPYEWLVKRFEKSKSFAEAFELPVPRLHKKRVNKPYHAKWQREMDWRTVKEHLLAKQW